MELRHRVEQVGDEARAVAHGFRREVRGCNTSPGTLSVYEQIFDGNDSI